MDANWTFHHPAWGNEAPSQVLRERILQACGGPPRVPPLSESTLALLRSLPRGDAFVQGGTVCIEAPDTTATVDVARLTSVLRDAMPWRKGPWNIHGVAIDAEWDAALKWSRMMDFGVDVAGCRVADVGASNGWYMYRMQSERPTSVIGLEPQAHARKTWDLLQHLAPLPNALMLPLGVDDMPLLGPRFDRILLMGLLYHHTDPVGLLRAARRALAPGGEIVVETIVVPGEGSSLLLPEGRYAGARGFWFLPTRDALYHLMRRAGFAHVELSAPVRTTPQEQRTTVWREGPSLAEGLDPEDVDRTIEGLPAPWRVLARLRP